MDYTWLRVPGSPYYDEREEMEENRSMKLYDIISEIENLIDYETGEILDYERFEQLKVDRDVKIENIALWIKNLEAEAKAVETEKKTLAEREKALNNKSDKLKEYLGYILAGNKFSSGKVAVSFRKSKSVEIGDGFMEWAKQNRDDLLKYKEPEFSKTAIKEAIELGQQIPFATVVEKQNLQIK